MNLKMAVANIYAMQTVWQTSKHLQNLEVAA